jgi:hypothetical protein
MALGVLVMLVMEPAIGNPDAASLCAWVERA